MFDLDVILGPVGSLSSEGDALDIRPRFGLCKLLGDWATASRLGVNIAFLGFQRPAKLSGSRGGHAG